VSAAARAGLAAAAPEVAIPLAIANEGRRVLEDSVRALKNFTEELIGANRRLAHFSPQLAQESARLALNNYHRTVGLTGATSLTGATFLRAIDDLRNAQHPFNVASSNASNILGGAGSGFATGALDELRVLPDIFEALRQRVDPSGEALKEIAEQLGHIAVEGLFPILGIVKQIAAWFGVQPIPGAPPLPGNWAQLLLNAAGMKPLPPANGPIHRFNPAAPMPKP
jgi:hypothetical protein